MGKLIWDDAGRLIPGCTVRQWLDSMDGHFIGNVTIDRVFYNYHNLTIAPPEDIDLDAEIVAIDDGYYGTPGVLTKK